MSNKNRSQFEPFSVFLVPEVEQRIRLFTQLADGEISGLGMVEEVDGGFIVTDIFLPRQMCSNAGTMLDPDDVAALMVRLTEEGREVEKLRFWWHSHDTLPTFWSATDNTCVEDLANDSYLVSLVTNKAGSVLCRLDLFQPVRATIDEVPVYVKGRDENLAAECRRLITENVQERTMAGLGTAVKDPRQVSSDLFPAVSRGYRGDISGRRELENRRFVSSGNREDRLTHWAETEDFPGSDYDGLLGLLDIGLDDDLELFRDDKEDNHE